MKEISKFVFLTGAAAMTFTSSAIAKDLGDGPWAKERFQVRVRAIDVLPDNDGNTTIGGTPDADNAVVPEVDLTYFLTENVALEVIAAVSQHDIKLKNRPAGAADLDLGEAWLLPPTLTLQYHFTPDEKFSPYIGAGLNYTLPFAEDHGRDATALEADGSVGYVLQAGTDYWINEHWGFNMDIKKVWVDVDVSVNSGAITGTHDLDPLIIGTGVSYRF